MIDRIRERLFHGACVKKQKGCCWYASKTTDRSEVPSQPGLRFCVLLHLPADIADAMTVPDRGNYLGPKAGNCTFSFFFGNALVLQICALRFVFRKLSSSVQQQTALREANAEDLMSRLRRSGDSCPKCLKHGTSAWETTRQPLCPHSSLLYLHIMAGWSAALQVGGRAA